MLIFFFRFQFECCGINNNTDYDGITAAQERFGYPKSCYPSDGSDANTLFTKVSSAIYTVSI